MSDAGVVHRARGRYAPSPTGRLHVGNARTALLAWLAARGQASSFVLRVEDLDAARVLPEAEAALMADLRWLGIDWDEGPDCGGPHGPYRQSERRGDYDAAIERLLSSGRAFPCACSRAEVARAVSAPHGPGDEGPRYPGTCRALRREEVEHRARAAGRAPVIRFDGRAERVTVLDEVHGLVEPLGRDGVDDFVLRRADGVAAYQLAVVVDDAAMGIAEVVRGDDLLSSTPRQIALHRALGQAVPRFAHVPLMLDEDGERLAKRTRPASLASLRDRGIDASEVVARLAASAGLWPAGRPAEANQILDATRGQPLWPRLTRGAGVWPRS